MIPDEQPHIQKSVLYGKNDTTEGLLYSKETVVLTPKRKASGSNPLRNISNAEGLKMKAFGVFDIRAAGEGYRSFVDLQKELLSIE